MKIQCKNCKHQHFKDADGYFIPFSVACLIFREKKNEVTGYIDYENEISNPLEKNKNNDCKDFNPTLFFKIKSFFKGETKCI
jgi:hypothetical protein